MRATKSHLSIKGSGSTVMRISRATLSAFFPHVTWIYGFVGAFVFWPYAWFSRYGPEKSLISTSVYTNWHVTRFRLKWVNRKKRYCFLTLATLHLLKFVFCCFFFCCPVSTWVDGNLWLRNKYENGIVKKRTIVIYGLGAHHQFTPKRFVVFMILTKIFTFQSKLKILTTFYT